MSVYDMRALLDAFKGENRLWPMSWDGNGNSSKA